MSFQRMTTSGSSPTEKSSETPRVDPVALVLELAELDQLPARVLEALELHDRLTSLSAARWITCACSAPAGGLADPVARDLPGRLVDVVADVVERAREPVHVVAVERRDERAVKQVDDLVRQAVALVLELLDLTDLGRPLRPGTLEQLEQRRAIATTFAGARL